MRDKYKYEFTIAKALPYVPLILANLSSKWAKYREYQKRGKVKIQGYDSIVYSTLMLPTSNFLVNYLLIPINYLWYKFVVRRNLILLAQKTDVILAQNLFPDFIIAYWLAKELNKPFIINLRADPKRWWYRMPLLKKIINEACYIITPSPTFYNDFKDDFNVKLIPHPIDKSFIYEGEKDYSIPRLISVCRLLDWKNIDLVINTLADLKVKGYSFEYKILGDGPELETLKSLVKYHNLDNNIKFEGFVNFKEVPKHLADASIYIQPSYPETLGRAFLEAAAAGCLIIGHEKTGVDGLLEHNVSGYFITKQDISKYLKKSFDNIGSVEFNKIIKKSTRVSKGLTWEVIGIKYDELYSTALK
ncbi:MAG: glycosyltransferase family 4 protein [Balneolaceae bacterium]